ncbi:hypothetical protein IEQ34_020755 [Dendrobium chrysotoxum]|uniref:Uncharacterized protein n=1 Tax=Dendrobium chrysotoxum TaxID=161865 RepID=A0AAV7G3P4_DENCH|nr:hypothetical protein IEQ34_020755 [Dendrobium chrysotoxum]
MPSLLAFRVWESALSFRMKQSSPLTFFSPTQRALANMLAVFWNLNLESTTKGANRAFCGVGAKPGSVAPNDLAIRAGVDLASSDGEFNVPHMWSHLPEDEAAGLDRSAAVLSQLRRSLVV